MIVAACLLVLLAVHTLARVVRATVRLLDLDPWATLVYLGLAELDGAKRSPRAGSRAQTTPKRTTAWSSAHGTAL